MSGGVAPAPGRFPWLVAILGGFAFVTLIGLGTWQVQRLHWKEALIATIEERTHSRHSRSPRSRHVQASTGDVDYMPVTATGTFLHAGERHFLATWQGQSGFFVYTPLELADGRFVFVNRGFVPYDLKDPAKRPQGQVEGKVTLTGLARNPLPAKPSSPRARQRSGQERLLLEGSRRRWRRSAGLPATAAIVPVFIDADDTPNPGGFPIGGVTLIDLPNSHLQYAVTWYGLAAALAGVHRSSCVMRRRISQVDRPAWRKRPSWRMKASGKPAATAAASGSG